MPWAVNTVDPEPRLGCRDQLAHHRRREGLRRRLGVHRRRRRRELRRASSPPTRSPVRSTGSTAVAATTTAIAVTGDVLYTVGHPHDCGHGRLEPADRPVAVPAGRRHQQAQVADADERGRHPGFVGALRRLPGGAAVALVADADRRTYTGRGRRPGASTANGDYTVLGGEFPAVNGIDQQGLVRFAKRTISPHVDPIQRYTELAPTLTPLGAGTVRIGWKAAWDRDNAQLKVEVLRGDTTATSTVIKTFTTSTTWWNRPPLGFVDTTAPPGSSQTYRIRMTDPIGQHPGRSARHGRRSRRAARRRRRRTTPASRPTTRLGNGVSARPAAPPLTTGPVRTT